MTENSITSFRRAALAAAATIAATGMAGAAAGRLEPSAQARAGLAMLHQGRFSMAAAAFADLSKQRPADPEGPVFESLVAWWRLIERPKDKAQHELFDARLDEGVKRAEALLGGGDAQRGKLFAGTALMLSAQSHAWEKSYFAAGSAARRGHKYLEEALAADPDLVDAWFALGAYKYFAAKMPWLVKALRFLVAIPGGDAEQGLRGLRSVAEKGAYFRTESQLLLSFIYSSDDEDDFRQSLDYIARARAAEPGSPLLAAAEARLHFLIGHLSSAEKTARESVAMMSEVPGVLPEIGAMARLRTALSLYYSYRPREALEQAVQLDSPAASVPEDAQPTLQSLLVRLRADLGETPRPPAGDPGGSDGAPDPSKPVRALTAAPVPSDPEAASAVARLTTATCAESIAVLEKAARLHPEDAVVRYHLARAYQIAGKNAEAVAELKKLVAPAAALPRLLQGWANLRLGSLQEAAGDRTAAEISYRRAAATKGFLFRRAAEDRLLHPGVKDPPEG